MVRKNISSPAISKSHRSHFSLDQRPSLVTDPRSLIRWPLNPQLVLSAPSFSFTSRSFAHRSLLLEELWKSLIPHQPYFTFTVVKSLNDSFRRRPGIATHRNLRVSANGVSYRITIRTWLVQIPSLRWSIFRCYMYSSETHTPCASHAGLVIVNDDLIDHAACQIPRSPRHLHITDALERQWKAIPKERKMTATALFDDGVSLQSISEVDFERPKIFVED